MKKLFTLLIASLLCAIFGCKEVTVETVICNVSYQKEGGDSTIVLPNNQEVEQFSKIKLPTYDFLENWKFDGWFVDDKKVVNNEYIINKDTIFVAKFSKVEKEEITDKENPEDELPKDEEPTDKENPDVDNPTEQPPTEEPTDKEFLCNVCFQSDIDTILPESMVVKKGTVIEKPINPTKDNYIFWEWTINGEKVNFPYIVNENIEFVANFKEKTLVEEFKSSLNSFYNYTLNSSFFENCYSQSLSNSIITLLDIPKSTNYNDPDFQKLCYTKNTFTGAITSGTTPTTINEYLDNKIIETKQKFYQNYNFLTESINYITKFNVDINNLFIDVEYQTITKEEIQQYFTETREIISLSYVNNHQTYYIKTILKFNCFELGKIYVNYGRLLDNFKNNYENYLYEIENR